MVKIGFIVEGETEEYILKHSNTLHQYLFDLGYDLNQDAVISIGGKSKFKNIEIMEQKINSLKILKVEKIFILLDSDDELPKSVSDSLMNLYSKQNPDGNYFINDIEFIFVAVKEVENWYLADSEAMRKWLSDDSFKEDDPESIDKAWDYLKTISQNNRGASKPLFAKKMLKLGFAIENSAKHPNCSSAKEFIDYFI